MSISDQVTNRTRGACIRQNSAQPALSDNLIERMLEPENMHRAWKRVKANQGAPGIDGMTIEEFPAFAREHWATIRQSLTDGAFSPSPVRRKIIPKPNGGERMLGIPTVLDRLIQQGINQVLTPIFDPEFSESSFGFRPGRSARGAIKQVKRYLKEGRRFAVDLDLKKFFDMVNHDVLMDRISRKVSDKVMLSLIRKFLQAGSMDGEIVQPSDIGTPQGGPLSPLLANIILDDFDKVLEDRGHKFARYADDLIILVKSLRAGERVKGNITQYLTKRLKLVVNEEKTKVVPTNQAKFLSFEFRGAKARWSNQAFMDFKYNVKKLTGRSKGNSMKTRIKDLNLYLRGWMNYFGISDYYSPIPEIDCWIRRRVRMCYWKQWRKPRTKVRNLLSMGVGKKWACLTGISSKSYWHLSKCYTTQLAMNNKWLEQQGLISIRDIWIKLAPFR